MDKIEECRKLCEAYPSVYFDATSYRNKGTVKYRGEFIFKGRRYRTGSSNPKLAYNKLLLKKQAVLDTYIESIALPQEQWLPAKGYEEFYLVSTLGRVFGLSLGRIMNPEPQKDGYLITGKGKFVHVLMGETFLGYDEKLFDRRMVIDHIDPNKKLDNSLYNLQLVSQRVNSFKDKVSFINDMYNIQEKGNKYYVVISQERLGSFYIKQDAIDFRNDKDKELGDWFFSWI